MLTLHSKRANSENVAEILGRVSGFMFRLHAEADEQERLAKDLREKIGAKMASQSEVVKSLSEEAATLRSELKTLTEETKARFALPKSSVRLENIYVEMGFSPAARNCYCAKWAVGYTPQQK